MKIKDWYTVENGKAVIEIRVAKLRQLFDERDPNPFTEKDLDDDAVDYILSSVQEVGIKKVGKIRVLTSDIINDESSSIIQEAFKDYFHYREVIARKKLRAVINIGFKSLLIGIIFLMGATYISSAFKWPASDNFIWHFLKEGLILLGWVSMWKPINIFLYEWWPLIDLRDAFIFLKEIKVDISQDNKTELNTHIL
ncbi:MAG: hypothetical protein ACO20H_07470 [Bacteriovoracaceae bacterium]